MADSGHFADFGFVYVNSQPRPGQTGNITIFVMKYRRVHQIIQQIRPLIVMNSQALFLNKSIGRAEVQLQGRRQ